MEVDRVVLFGSYAKGTANESCDVDIAVFVSPPLNGRRHEVGCRLWMLTPGLNGFIEPYVIPMVEIELGNPIALKILRTGMGI
ncbi:MAG: nucleotidyltransferase domain-containing protein [Deltaproteobacteria bacterium]|jgi:hypothetical protein|nr:nucleotidyltransferase domain-containing protein [Deltaproteobacteria bacterium]